MFYNEFTGTADINNSSMKGYTIFLFDTNTKEVNAAAYISPDARKESKTWMINYIVTSKNRRRNGYGRMLLNRIEQFVGVLDEDCENLLVLVMETSNENLNENLRLFYEKCNFIYSNKTAFEGTLSMERKINRHDNVFQIYKTIEDQDNGTVSLYFDPLRCDSIKRTSKDTFRASLTYSKKRNVNLDEIAFVNPRNSKIGETLQMNMIATIQKDIYERFFEGTKQFCNLDESPNLNTIKANVNEIAKSIGYNLDNEL